jgi:hypothetical protein
MEQPQRKKPHTITQTNDPKSKQNKMGQQSNQKIHNNHKKNHYKKNPRMHNIRPKRPNKIKKQGH